jgi:hypothetical protein
MPSSSTHTTHGLHTTLPVPKRALPYSVAGRKWLPDFVTRAIFGKPLAASREEWACVVEGLGRGDPAMDRIVAWMFEANPGQTKALFEQALTRGIQTVDEPPAPLKEFFDCIDNAPGWLDPALLVEGAKVAQSSGMVSFYVLRDMALMGGYAYFSSLNQTLAATGSLQKDAALRLGETGKWLADVTTPHGLERFGAGFITTIRVRMVHALIRRALTKRGDWDANTWGVPINQIDMLATYLAFGPVTVLGARLFGVPIGKADSRAAMHMWRYIGWLSGVEEQWLALTEGDGWRKLYHTFLTHRLPDEKVGLLGTALLKEPLTRRLPGLERYPLLTKLVRRYIYHKHVSNSALILGPMQRRRLGLPILALPWYPILSAPVRFLVISWYRWRGGRALEEHTARTVAKQQRLLSSYFGDREVGIIKPSAGHPAHVG